MSGRRRIPVRVTKDAARQIRSGHPWVFDRSITSIGLDDDSRAGDLAVVFDSDRSFMAVGLYDPHSPIRVKLVHHGKPATIDRSFWTTRIGASVERRAPLASDPGTTAYRLVHGENDGLPGVVVDLYDDTAVLKLYSAAWEPHLDDLTAAVAEAIGPRTLVLRWARNADRELRGDADSGGATGPVALMGDLSSGPVRYRENGLWFDADVVHGQKTGAFLDQRENRDLVRRLAGGRRVLDVYSSAGGFSVHAAAGGATVVHSVDLSPWATEAAVRNMAANGSIGAVARCRHSTTTGDAVEEMAALAARGQRFDLVVVDPPSFASRASQVQGALRAYGRLTEAAVHLLEPGGTLVQASCSSRVGADVFIEQVERSARGAGRTLRSVRHTGQPLDHPVGFPEGAYLKAVVATV